MNVVTDKYPVGTLITREVLNACKSARGGYTRKMIESLGVRYPLVTGWKRRILGKAVGWHHQQLGDIYPRPSVLCFARRMEVTLQRHDAKKGGQREWRKEELFDLIDHLRMELDELEGAASFEETAAEAVDVANIAMMIADKFMPLDEDQ